MAVLRMEKYRIATYKEHAPELLSLLQKFGVTELTPVTHEDLKENELLSFDHHRDSSRLDVALKFLSKFYTDSSLRAIFEGGRVCTTNEEIESLVKNYDFNSVVDEVQTLETNLNQVSQKISHLSEEYRLLHAWERLSLPLNESLETTTTLTIPLRGSARVLANFRKKLEEKTNLISLETIGETTILLTFFKEDISLIDETISSFSLERVTLPEKERTASEELIRLKKEEAEAIHKKTEIEEKITVLAKENIPHLKILSDYYLWKKQQLDLALTAPSTDHIAIFEAWILERAFPRVKETLETKIKLIAIEPCPLKDGEVPPTEIENTGILNPFETITRLYGLPTHQDLDPTPFLSIFFFIFFGLCLGDVGYGTTLMLITGTILYKYRLDKTLKQLLSILFYGGFGSVIAGIFLGGYLGIDTSLLPPAIKNLQLIDPVKSPLPMFYLSLALGFAHIAFGIGLKLWREYRDGNKLDAILDNMPWLSLFLGFALLGMSQFGIIPASSGINWFIYASLGLIVITQGRTSKNIFAKIIYGILSLYNLVGYFSDLLSYSRILALGLATSALSFSINLIANFIGDLLPSFLGIIVTMIILFLGHALNMTIGIMGAFIHSARLQFVEFFSKFLIGSGRTFKPFFQQERNIILLRRTEI